MLNLNMLIFNYGGCFSITIGYLSFLSFHYFYKLPIQNKLDPECIKAQMISKEIAIEKHRYIQFMGVSMLIGNIVIVLLKEISNSHQCLFSYSEIYLLSIFVCVFVLQNAKVCIMFTLLSIVTLIMINSNKYMDYKLIENSVNSINGCLISWCIMSNCQKEGEENYISKKNIKEK